MGGIQRGAAENGTAMFSLTGSIRYWVSRRTVDMRNSINGLMAIVEGEFNLKYTSGDAFVFFSNDGSTIKILRWDTDGYLLYHKKLAKGTFESTAPDGGRAPPVTSRLGIASVL